MGMFDKLRCDYPLPDPEFQKAEFQTKDLGCLLDNYRIDRKGRLWLTRMILYSPKIKRADRIKSKPEDTHFHGEFCFYTYAKRQPVEYRARFTHGNLEWLRRVAGPGSPFVDSLKHLAREARYLEEERERQRERLLQRLEQLDPEVAKKTVTAFQSRPIAASWLIAGCISLDGASPVEALARGKRRQLLKMIADIHKFC